MKKYIVLMCFMGTTFCASVTNNSKMQILLTQLALRSKQLLEQVKKTVRSASTGNLLGDIAQGTKLKKTPKPEEKPKPKTQGGLESTLGESDLLKKAQEILNEKAKQKNIQGASEEEWEEAEKIKPAASPAPKLSKPLFGSSLPELKFNAKGTSAEISNALANYISLLDLYLEYKKDNKSEISSQSKERIKKDEESVDAIPDEKYSKSQKLLFHSKIQGLRNTYASLNLLPYTPKPLSPKPTTPAQPTKGPITTETPKSGAPVVPKKTFSPITGGGDLFSQIAASQSSKLKPTKASSEIASIDFKKLSDDKIVETVNKYQNSINQFSLKQLIDIAADKEVLDTLDPDIIDDLKQAAKAKKGEANPGQLSALKFGYGIA